jgi:dihydrofolate reductase
MRKLILSEFVTVDGVMEGPAAQPGLPRSGWVLPFMSEEQHAYKLAEVLEAESLLIGRVTYETFAEAWPARSGAFADKMNAMPKHVASTTLRHPGWTNAWVIKDEVVTAVARLKEQDGDPILIAGSLTLARKLMACGLIDEYRLMQIPVVLGSGRRLFGPQDKIGLRLVDQRAFPLGIVLLTYHAVPADDCRT